MKKFRVRLRDQAAVPNAFAKIEKLFREHPLAEISLYDNGFPYLGPTQLRKWWWCKQHGLRYAGIPY